MSQSQEGERQGDLGTQLQGSTTGSHSGEPFCEEGKGQSEVLLQTDETLFSGETALKLTHDKSKDEGTGDDAPTPVFRSTRVNEPAAAEEEEEESLQEDSIPCFVKHFDR